MKLKTFPLAAGAYVRLDTTLTHACEIDDDGYPIRVICGRVQIESILDDLTAATDAPPTCKRCLSLSGGINA